MEAIPSVVAPPSGGAELDGGARDHPGLNLLPKSSDNQPIEPTPIPERIRAKYPTREAINRGVRMPTKRIDR